MRTEISPGPPGELLITLRKPVSLGGETYAVLRLREPTGDEVAQVESLSGTAADVMAISLIAGVPRSAVVQIGARDLVQAGEYIGAFMQGGRHQDLGEDLLLTFGKPVKIGDQTFTDLRLREPTGEEMIKMEAVKGMAGNIFDLALIGAVPQAVVGQLGVSQIVRGAEFLARFMKGAQPTGAP